MKLSARLRMWSSGLGVAVAVLDAAATVLEYLEVEEDEEDEDDS